MRPFSRPAVALLGLLVLGTRWHDTRAGGTLAAQQPRPSPWAAFVEPDFPFFSSVLDARRLGSGWPTDNLTSRGLVLNLGHGLWACVDLDLLRVSAIWMGAGVTPVSMAQVSYQVAGVKAPEGQGTLPAIDGVPWIATGLYAGWQSAEDGAPVSFADPRPVGQDPRELGRGPLDPALGRFTAVRLTQDGVVLEYEVRGIPVEERIGARLDAGDPVIERRFRLGPTPRALWVVLGGSDATAGDALTVALSDTRAATLTRQPNGLYAIRIGAAPTPIEFAVAIRQRGTARPPDLQPARSEAPPSARWPEPVMTQGTMAPSRGAYVVDRIPIPTDNPWRRNVRLADVAFARDGRAAAVTFDGDVWTIDGLRGDLGRVTWRRFASGLHEPLGLVFREADLFVFDRNGLWRLGDTDGNGEADRHELFSHAFAQTAETREFAMSVRLGPDGSFVIAKGGQQLTSIGRDNGTVLRIAADGRSTSRLGYGLRQPFAAVHPRTGLVTASDQQGNYVPATPLHEIRDEQYYGFIPLILPKEQYPAPIAEPVTWIPHAISASAAGQVWLTGARMGSIDDGLVLLNYYRPEALLVRVDDATRPTQGAVVSLTRDFDFAPLAGSVNPTDGQLYVAGFQIWGTDAAAISGLARVRFTGSPSTLPRAVVPMQEGVHLTFDVPLDRRAASDPANYSAERWNYRRSAEYGSPHLSLYLRNGQDTMVPSSAVVSRDGRSVFIGLPDMRPVMQMRLGWTLKTATGETFDQTAYFTVRAMAPFGTIAAGFDTRTIDLTPRPPTPSATPAAADAASGQRIATRMGCLGCHSVDGSVVGRVGPSWKGLAGSTRGFSNGGTAVADAAYLRRSILTPAAEVVAGFEQSDAGMPSYAGALTDADIEALVLFIQSLK